MDVVDPGALAWALEEQQRSRARLGEVLLSAGLVRRDHMHRALARVWDCDFVDLRKAALDAELAKPHDPAVMVREGWIPYAREDGVTLVATSEEPTPERAAALADRLGVEQIEFVATSDWDVADAVERVFRAEIADDAANALHRRDRRLSARGGLSAVQIGFGVLALLVIAAGVALEPVTTLVVTAITLNAILIVAIGFKLVISLVGWRAVQRGEDEDVPAIPAHELPRYTILVPMYGEAAVMGDLIRSMEAIDYPPERLQVLLLLEEEDYDTIAAARAALSPGNIRIVVVPDGQPRTKPRACNVGLLLASGEHLVIYDAEDRPEPHQLREAVGLFRVVPENVTCLQSRLNWFNSTENVLTRLFTLEYSYWFDYMLAGLDRLRLPLPLGGTSNHFRTSALREAGGWDAFNVTEDADLGVRSHVLGQRVGVMAATTYEEAVTRVRAWIPQRTRWIKGYIQTTIVHSRNPLRMLSSLGVRGSIGFVALIAGTPIAFLITPIVWAFFGLWMASLAGAPTPDPLPGVFGVIGLVNLVASNAALVLLHALAVVRRRWWRLAPFALLAPLYWFLHSYAAWRALKQMFTDPYRWEKTQHGLTDEVQPQLATRITALEAALAETAATSLETAPTAGGGADPHHDRTDRSDSA